MTIFYAMAKNVLGGDLIACSQQPLTGFYRDGCCNTGETDLGVHVVCARMSEAFLEFTKTRGNDLSCARPEAAFPGLAPDDQWCLCAARWEEARLAGCAPPVVLEATHILALEFCDLEDLKAHAISPD